jgi:hypothetical protein
MMPPTWKVLFGQFNGKITLVISSISLLGIFFIYRNRLTWYQTSLLTILVMVFGLQGVAGWELESNGQLCLEFKLSES